MTAGVVVSGAVVVSAVVLGLVVLGFVMVRSARESDRLPVGPAFDR